MKIAEIEYTPNPNAVKFILDEPLTTFGVTGEFHSVDEAEDVLLPKLLFEIEHVTSVFYTDRWLTVTQDGKADWHDLLREVAAPIRDATPEDARLADDYDGPSREAVEGEGVGLDDERIALIQELLDDHIMPFLQGDGGGLEIKGLVNDQLLIRYQGACGTCPSSTMGTLMAIENLVQMEVDPGLDVVSI